MRVYMVSNTSWSLRNFRQGLIRALIADGHSVTIVAPLDDSSEKLQQWGCDYHPLRIDRKGNNPLRDALTCIWLWRFYRRQRPDAVLHYTIKPVIYGSIAARLAGVPVVNTITGLGTAFIRETWMTKVVRRLYRFALSGWRSVVFQNNDDAQLFLGQGLLAAKQLQLVPGSGVDLQRFSAKPLPSGSAFTFLMVARLLGDKGIREYAEAARQLRAEFPDVRFQLLGAAGDENKTAITADEIEDWKRQSTVDYLGSTDDVRPFIEAADCVVLPSYREGTPRSLLEACAMARPCIATDVPGCREVVEDGVNGYLCEVRDADSLAAACRKLLSLPLEQRQHFAAAARQKAESTFSETVVVDRYKAFLADAYAS